MRAVLAAKGTASRITKYRRLPIHFFIALKLIGRPPGVVMASLGTGIHGVNWNSRVDFPAGCQRTPGPVNLQCSSQVLREPILIQRPEQIPKPKRTLVQPIPQTLFLLQSRSAPKSVSVYGSLPLQRESRKGESDCDRETQRPSKSCRPSGPDYPRSREVLVLYRKRE